ncbi:MAG TPA: SDR family oxidoreductase, partial [Gemmatimonadales bacterium]|nr:SDR family oxidoreductase [Gemmatimonadales bacterium]
IARRHVGGLVNQLESFTWPSRAASAIGFIDMMINYTKANSPLPRSIDAVDVGNTAAFLASPLAAGITGTTVYVDNGYHAMGMAVTPPA